MDTKSILDDKYYHPLTGFNRRDWLLPKLVIPFGYLHLIDLLDNYVFEVINASPPNSNKLIKRLLDTDKKVLAVTKSGDDLPEMRLKSIVDACLGWKHKSSPTDIYSEDESYSTCFLFSEIIPTWTEDPHYFGVDFINSKHQLDKFLLS